MSNWNGEGEPSVDVSLYSYSTGELKLIPNSAKATKKKAIHEMAVLIDDCVFASDAALILYEAGYTKSKVKPLPKDWYNTYHNSLDDHQLSVYKYLTQKGYCIRSAD